MIELSITQFVVGFVTVFFLGVSIGGILESVSNSLVINDYKSAIKGYREALGYLDGADE
jgi:hypothetical protein